jgi:ABC-type multidrug transport system, ATPase and permease components
MSLKRDLGDWKKLFRFTRPCRAQWLAGQMLLPLSTFTWLMLTAVAVKTCTQSIIARDFSLTLSALGYLVGGLAAAAALEIVGRSCYGRSMSLVAAGLRCALMRRFLRLPPSPEAEHSGARLSRLNQDVDYAASAVGEHLRALALPSLVGLGSLAVVCATNLELGALSLLMTAIVSFVHLRFAPRYRSIALRQQEAQAELSGRYGDSLAGAMTIRLFGLERMLDARIAEAAGRVSALETEQVETEAKHDLASWIFQFSSYSVSILLGCILVAKGRAKLPDVLFVAQITGNINWFASGLGTALADLQKSLNASRRIFEQIEEADEIDGFGSAAVASPPRDGDAERGATAEGACPIIELRELSIRYRDRPAVDRVSLAIAERESLAIIGPSGGGKSSLLKAMLQLVPYEGEILVRGRSVRDYSLESLRLSIGYVPQDGLLFEGSVYDNILLGDPDASFDQVAEAAREAYALGFIEALPKGWDTIVGEGGFKLSGGQRQRISIARACLKDAPLLLLDEATSALDAESERQVQAALERLMDDKTIVVVAHRLSTIRRASRIIVMDSGRIVESGSREELLAARGLYSRLDELQFGERD